MNFESVPTWFGPLTLAAIWVLAMLAIIISNWRIRRASFVAGTRAHQISWVNFVPILVLFVAIQWILNNWHRWLGDILALGIHLAVLTILVVRSARNRRKQEQ